MRKFFHAYTDKYKKKCVKAMFIILAPFVQICIIINVLIIMNYRRIFNKDFILPLLSISLICVVAGIVIVSAALYIKNYMIKYHSRYTYFEIEEKVIIFSKFSGIVSTGGEKNIFREVYVIPYKDFVSVEKHKKKPFIIINGNIKKYYHHNFRLGYHFSKGDIVFDNWWLNEYGYESLNTLTVHDFFEHPGKIIKSVKHSHELFLSIPPPRPLEHYIASSIPTAPKRTAGSTANKRFVKR